jgi:hypothetical protein
MGVATRNSTAWPCFSLSLTSPRDRIGAGLMHTALGGQNFRAVITSQVIKAERQFAF